MKIVLRLLLALMLLSFCFSVQAEESIWGFDYDDYKIESYQGSGDIVVIPETIDGCTVDILGMNLFNGDSSLTSLTLPSTVKQVEENVISFCDNLTELIIPEGVQIIEDNSFVQNSALTEVVIPASVRYIGKSCFGSSENLAKVTFLGKCPIFAGNALDWIADDAEIYVPDDQYDAYAAALYEAECTSAVLPSGANAVEYDWTTDPSSFDFDAATGTITMYNGFDAIVEVPAEINGIPVKAIGENAFYGHRYLCVLTLPEGLESIGVSAFESCQTLLHIDFPSTLKNIGDRAFHTGYMGYVLKLPSVVTIGDEAFAQCIRISEPIELPEGLKTIGNGAFNSCSWLSEVYIPASVESIGEKVFADSALNYLVFEGRTLPAMAENTLESCWYLTDIDLNTKTSKKEAQNLQAAVDAQGLECYVWRMQNPDVDYVQDGLEVYENGVWTAYTGEQSYLRPWDIFDDVVVTAIGDGLFKGNQTIEYFSVPYNDLFTTIGAEAFAGSSVKTVDLFDSVTTIGDGAFRDCLNIEEMTLPESVTDVGSAALSGCTNLKKLTVLCDPSILPDDLLAGCSEDMEIYASETASAEALKHLSTLAGRAWNNPVTRIGEELPEMQDMPYESLPGDDFWYDSDFVRLDRYQGYECNLVLPREIDGVQLTLMGADVLGRAVVYDGEEAELPVVSVVIPETYTEIAPYAFAGCEALETVICYGPIELLPECAFQNCTSLREVVFVNGVGGFGMDTFDGCTNLETLYVGPYLEKDSAAPVACITDPAQLPDIDSLLERVKTNPIPAPEPTAVPEPAVPVGEEGKPFFGIWNGIEMVMDGQSLSLADYEMTMMLILLEDGRMIITDEPIDLSDLGILDGVEAPGWHVENGIAIGDGCTMIILEDGRLMLSEGDSQLIFEYSGALPNGNDTFVAPEESAQGDRLGVKYICINAEVSGYTVDASMLGGEYSATFHKDGSLDFMMAGQPIPGLRWTEASNGNFLVDLYGNQLEIIWTEAGFDMNYMDSMLMHFIP